MAHIPYSTPQTRNYRATTLQSSSNKQALDAKNDASYELESIIDHTLNERGEMAYKVRWKGYGTSDEIYITHKKFNSKDVVSEY
jgi:hypothetical protein